MFMGPIKLKYGLDEWPPLGELLLLGLQWFAIAVPIVIIIGNIVAGLHFDSPAEQGVYMQKVFFITGLSLLAQVLWGHRLPLISGPATILLVGIVAGQAGGRSAVYTAIATGGLALFLLNTAGLFKRLRKLFTPSVVAAILILIAFTLTPMILDLILAAPEKGGSLPRLLFSLIFVLLLFGAGRYAAGFWKSTLLLWALAAGTIIHVLLFPQGLEPAGGRAVGAISGFCQNMNLKPAFEPGLLISFLVCFLALSINDLGSMYSVAALLKPEGMSKRISRGLSVTGLLNIIAGLLGVIGPVNFSLSPGVIASTGSASRFTLIPTGMILAGMAFVPQAIAFVSAAPRAVVGTILLYIMCSQIAAGLIMALNTEGGFTFESGLVMGLPLMLSIIISFMPSGVVNTFPAAIRPILGNGFVDGVLAALIMEHVVFRKTAAPH